MAAVQWSGGKIKSVGDAKAMMRHSDRAERIKHEHSNADIDTTRTPENFSYFNLSYAQKCKKYDARLSEIECGAMSSGKNARTMMQSLIIPAPEDISKDETKDWFMSVGRILEDRYGSDMIDMDVHFDEIHDYIKPETGEVVLSRAHGHVCLVPTVNGKLNGKKFSERKNIVSLNEAIQKMSLEKYGVKFMTGEKRKGTKTVEQLKRESEAAASMMETTVAKYRKTKRRTEELEARADEIEGMEIRAKRKQKKADEDAESIAEREREVARREAAVSAREREAEQTRATYQNLINRANEALHNGPPDEYIEWSKKKPYPSSVPGKKSTIYEQWVAHEKALKIVASMPTFDHDGNGIDDQYD